jgi:hypothetical protein
MGTRPLRTVRPKDPRALATRIPYALPWGQFSSPRARQALPTKPIAERCRVLRLGEAEYDEVSIVTAQGVRERRRRQGRRSAVHELAILEAAHPFRRQHDQATDKREAIEKAAKEFGLDPTKLMAERRP